MAVPQQAKEQIERFLADGDKLGAIRHLRDNYKFSLDESRRLVDALQAQYVPKETPTAGSLPDSPLDDLSRAHIAQLIAKGEKIDAVKFAKERFQLNLKDAKQMVEGVRKQSRNTRKMWHNDSPAHWILLIFGVLGAAFTAVTCGLFISQTRTLEKSELITGRIVDMRSRGKGLKAPVIEYEWNGQRWLYASTAYSSLELYELNEEIPVYVNTEDPHVVIPDTFLDRWMGIGILGTIGVCFIIGPLLVYFIAFRR